MQLHNLSFSPRAAMVIKEKTKKTNGPHLRLNMPFASESDFICFDKATQTSSEDTLDDPLQVKANPYTAHISVPGKEKYYLWKTRSRLQEKCPTVQSGLEFKNFLLEEKHKTGIADLELHESISLNPITEECNEVQSMNRKTINPKSLLLML